MYVDRVSEDPRRWAWAAGLAACLGAGCGSPSPPPAPAPVASVRAPAPPSEPKAPDRTPADAGFPARFARSLRGLAVSSRDPVEWPARLADVEELAAVQAWLAEGGDPRRLPRDQQDALRRVDGDLAALGYPLAFHPYLYVNPAAEPTARPPSLDAELDKVPEAPDTALAWEATAWVLWDRLRGQLATLAAELRAAQRREPGARPLPSGDLGLSLEIAQGLRPYVRSLIPQDSARAWASEWLTPAHTTLRELVWALSRMARRPRKAARAALMMASIGGEADLAWIGPWAFAPASSWLGGPPDSVEGWWMLGECARRQRRVRKLMPLPPEEGGALELRAFRHLVESVGEGPPEGPEEGARLALGVGRLMAFHLEVGNPEDALAVFARHRLALLHTENLGAGRIFRQVVELWAEGPAEEGPGEEELGPVLSWLEAHPDATRGERREQAIKGHLDVLFGRLFDE